MRILKLLNLSRTAPVLRVFLAKAHHFAMLLLTVYFKKIMKDLAHHLEEFRKDFFESLRHVHHEHELEEIRLKFLSRNGLIANFMSKLKNLSSEEKRVYGPLLNELKEAAHTAFDHKQQEFVRKTHEKELAKDTSFDVTAYKQPNRGSLHPYTLITQEIEDIFLSMGFEIASGPEVETPWYNFEALNIPKDHPARDMHDTFWLTLPGYLMRTHTSTVQIHAMQKNKPPLALCAPGRVFRHEATDATHDFMFMQCEGMLIDKNISLAHLIGAVKLFMAALFKKSDLHTRIRPSYFPFVEPGIEFDISCPFCSTGCSICKKSRWLEMGGAGLIHPHVLTACNIDPTVYSGWAFGFGLSRLAILKYQIPDVRLFQSNSLDFLKQF